LPPKVQLDDKHDEAATCHATILARTQTAKPRMPGPKWCR
jgi:hypothetical protein